LYVQSFGSVGDENAATPNMRPQAPHSAPSTVRHSVRGHPVSDVIEGTLWNRELGSVSEEVVTALVQQLFEGIRDYLVQVRACTYRRETLWHTFRATRQALSI
jgi:hypothetical protein